MTLRAVCAFVVAVLLVSACSKEDDVLDKKEFGQVRRANIALADALADRIIEKKIDSGEIIDVCDDRLPDNIKRSDYTFTGEIGSEALSYVKNQFSAQMKADGWSMRDRTLDETLDRIWAKGERTVGVNIMPGSEPSKPPTVSITTSTPCADAPGVGEY